MVKVKVLPVPRAAFDPTRPVSTLLKSQITQLQDAVLQAVDTEEEAARCVQTLTALLQELRPQTAPSPHGVSRQNSRSARRSATGSSTTKAKKARKAKTPKKRTAPTGAASGRTRR